MPSCSQINRKRLSQLAMQRRLHRGVLTASDDKALCTKLGISAKQRTKLKQKASDMREANAQQIAALRKQSQAGKDPLEARKEINASIVELRRKAESDILKELSPSQRTAYENLVGEKFKFTMDKRVKRGKKGKKRAR